MLRTGLPFTPEQFLALTQAVGLDEHAVAAALAYSAHQFLGAGQRRIAETVWRYLEPLLRELPRV